ncbi:MAG TPA: hypothetical protein DEO82_06765 [Eubacterium sp.]|jgi:tRNA(Phe) wybutosine-synthesizing methylase Tyw3|nr:hypothetical protein [Lachnospiraceae bacterium]HBZ53459.1 hypothetical protein [Eubacterium sp.]
MDDIIRSLIDIEEKASAILSDASQKQVMISKEYEDKLVDFTTKQKEESEIILKDFQEKLEEKKKTTLQDIKDENERRITLVKDIYDNNHTKIAEHIFRQIIM